MTGTLITTMDTLITEPTCEPLDVDEVKKHLKFTPTTEDTLIDLWISAARQLFEAQTGRQAIYATRERWYSGAPFSLVLELPHPPLVSVVSVSYGDSTLDADSYDVLAPSGALCGRGLIALPYGSTWPTVTEAPNALRVRYVCGYGAAPGAVPELVKSALLMIVGLFHKERTEVREGAAVRLPLGAQEIIRQFEYTARPVLPVPRG